MTAHFAKRGNLADVSAKSASLGTVAQLLGTMVILSLSSSARYFALFIFVFNLFMGFRIDIRLGLYCCIEQSQQEIPGSP